MVSALDLGPEGREFEPRPVHPSCVQAKHLILTVPLSAQVYKLEPVNCLGTKCREVTWGGLLYLKGNYQMLVCKSKCRKISIRSLCPALLDWQ